MKMINVGFIGCGRIADLHFEGYRNNPNARLYAICDSNPNILAARKKQWNVEKTYTDYRKLLADSEIDAVEIITPHDLHEQMVIDAARAAKHIAVQKPMTISLKSADRMIKEAKKAGVVFKITDNYVFYPPIVLAKNMIDNGELGEPQMIRIKEISGPHGGWKIDADTYGWRFQEFSQGRFSETFDHGHHEWTTAWYLLGDVECVAGWIDSVDGIVDCPSLITWKYKNGAKYGVCEFNYCSELHVPSKYYPNDEWFEITGSKGVIFINRCTGNIHTGPAVSFFNGHEWKYFDVKSDWVEGFIGATNNFINAIMGKETPMLSGEQGKEILRFAFAIQKAAKARREVWLDELEKPLSFLYAWQKRRRDIKNSFPNTVAKKSLFKRENLSKYASQAKTLTEEFVKRFDPDASAGWEGVAGLKLTADGGVAEMKMSIHVRGGKAELRQGEIPENAGITLIIPAGTWAGILLGKKRLETALFQGKLKVEGEPHEGLKLRAAFKI
jgi:predicted dehydrogenase